ncbi:PREDICTED: uncharacterized protein LOC105560198 [Vollenhovia emeryi]|uniref:uncharacterized protein LOC105560198 n=1 Tax=Vollenhovia emeryi TaxID=411798 RepID=UPI0005F42B7B|nr:PREDICTED: uncharacterized protein LOC105560198 [Vollenhovia emeryi]
MGSPLSPIIADIVMQDLEENILNSLDIKPAIYYRYVDDIIMVAPVDRTNEILTKFNNYHNRLQFTIEYENKRKLSFLDLSLVIIDNRIYIDWYHKETFSGRLLSYFSNHPDCHKIGTIYSLVDRAIMLSHPMFHQKNIEFAIRVLLENGYPLNLVFEKINKRIKKLMNVKEEDANTSTNNNPEKSNNFIVIPYINGISEKVESLIDKSKFRIGYHCLNKLEKFVKVHKDKNKKLENSNVIYRINCKDCEASCVGQTKRKLETRIKEHKYNQRLDPSKHSVVSEHIINYKHEFDWDNTLILDVERNWNKRLISEMIHIKQQTNGIHSQTDTELLDDSYFDLIDKLNNK